MSLRWIARKFDDDFASMVCGEYSARTKSGVTLNSVRFWDCADTVSQLPAVLENGSEKWLDYLKSEISRVKENLRIKRTVRVRPPTKTIPNSCQADDGAAVTS